jgi:hypothetical protein
MPQVRVLQQIGYLVPIERSSASVEALFGKSASNPLVDSNHDSHLLMGDRPYGVSVVAPLSGVQTVDLPGAGDDPRYEKRNATNLFKPMHSEAFWVMLLVLATLGVFSFGVHIGPIRAEVGST